MKTGPYRKISHYLPPVMTVYRFPTNLQGCWRQRANNELKHKLWSFHKTVTPLPFKSQNIPWTLAPPKLQLFSVYCSNVRNLIWCYSFVSYFPGHRQSSFKVFLDNKSVYFHFLSYTRLILPGFSLTSWKSSFIRREPKVVLRLMQVKTPKVR